MAKEIERKYLVKDLSFKSMTSDIIHICQGYISRRPEGTVRVRIKGNRGFITIKGKNAGVSRDEWEYEIPLADAEEMLTRVCEGTVIDKHRHIVEYHGFTWEIDVFHGSHEGLIIAEIELPSADTAFPLPPFIAEEVTGNPDYYNSNL